MPKHLNVLFIHRHNFGTMAFSASAFCIDPKPGEKAVRDKPKTGRFHLVVTRNHPLIAVIWGTRLGYSEYRAEECLRNSG